MIRDISNLSLTNTTFGLTSPTEQAQSLASQNHLVVQKNFMFLVGILGPVAPQGYEPKCGTNYLNYLLQALLTH